MDLSISWFKIMKEINIKKWFWIKMNGPNEKFWMYQNIAIVEYYLLFFKKKIIIVTFEKKFWFYLSIILKVQYHIKCYFFNYIFSTNF